MGSGRYLNPKDALSPNDKTGVLLRKYGATKTSPPNSITSLPTGKALVCVVDNGPFQAAAWVHDDDELGRCLDPRDLRPITWLLVDTQVAEDLSKLSPFG